MKHSMSMQKTKNSEVEMNINHSSIVVPCEIK